jgi:hypothetical protein
VSELARKFDVGHGTVQRALRTLEATGAVRLEARGHLGTYILERDLRRLWEAAGTPVLLGGFPLPFTPRLRARVTALQQELRRVGVPAEIVYLDGCRKRLGQLRLGRLDFIVVSRFAAERAWENQRDVGVVRNFGPNTYCDPGTFRLAYRNLPPRRVGVDRRSCEHYWRTVEVFPQSEDLFINLPYLAIPEALARGDVDAALWGFDTAWPFPQAEGVKFEAIPPSPIDAAIGEACLVVLAKNSLVYELMARQLDPVRIKAGLEAVLRGEQLPLA